MPLHLTEKCYNRGHFEINYIQKNMSLSGPEYKELQEALIDAFPDKASLEQMLSLINKNLNAIAGGNNLNEIVFNIIKKAKAENWVKDLISAARQSNPRNPKLKAIAKELSVPSPSTPTRRSTQQPPQILTPNRRNFFYLALGGGACFVTGVFYGNSINQPSQTAEPKTPSESSPIPKSTPIPQSGLLLETFDSEVVTVDSRGKIISTIPRQAQYFKEDLLNGVILEMVKIPGGRFMMGTEDEEIERLVNKFDPKREVFRTEKPQHEVTVKSFYMGRYPITQAQWKAVAALPKVKGNLNPDPSRFKGDNLPVEQVSWYDAVEFCDRLSDYTGKQYRLPSEAEWEYACRTGINTNRPFYFGETITTDLANYNGNYIYASEQKGIDRETTTDVGEFPPNAFGLYDMHGNVWEWCQDTWHTNYNNAPTDGTARNDNDNRSRVLRGGSLVSIPQYCRSASRVTHSSEATKSSHGFRVVWS